MITLAQRESVGWQNKTFDAELTKTLILPQ
jgi:hypothetical protein